MPVIQFCKAVFVHIPKTAGRAIMAAMGVPENIEDGRSNLYGADPVSGRFWLHHLTAFEMLDQQWLQKCVPGSEKWYRFAFVRNPWERLLSSYTFQRNIQRAGLAASFADHVREVHAKLENSDVSSLFITDHPQYRFVYGAKDELLVNALGRFEFLQESFDAICRKLRVPKRIVAPANVSRGRPEDALEANYTQELVDLVGAAYSKDCERFGYIYEGNHSVSEACP
jgi:hypothetical protein